MSEFSSEAKDANDTINYLPSVKHKWDFWNPYYGRKLAPMQSAQFNYGPFSIGETKWQLELRFPSYSFWLKRINGNANDEHLSFQFTELDDPVDNFTFTVADQEVCIGLGPSIPLKDDWNLDFEAFVTPENYASGLPCDFRVVVLDKNDEEKEIAEFAAHRSILSKGSSVFKAMLAPDSKFKEAKEGVLRIGNFSPETVKSLLIYIYTGNENLVDGKPYSEAMELLDAAEQYQLDEVFKKQCGVRLLALISAENALKLFTVADRYKLPEMKQATLEYIIKNRHDVIHRENIDDDLKNEFTKTFFSD